MNRRLPLSKICLVLSLRGLKLLFCRNQISPTFNYALRALLGYLQSFNMLSIGNDGRILFDINVSDTSSQLHIHRFH
ncbi:hypothetical protein GcM3_c208o11 [Golovinomyces cichoracearum]|uniref:Uncharacterized protein n=1 Tax=Golovinomyces cichoracearum TaxID=62708 RepID=A0A420IN43_9PEZI|nr:hypothetical protein GcM3_c208o11 [Golovinomyces cichoracearum]